MKTKSTTEVISNFLSQKDPLVELSKVYTILDVLREDVRLAKTGDLDLSLSEVHSMLDDSANDLDETIEFLSAVQAEVLYDMQQEVLEEDPADEILKVH